MEKPFLPFNDYLGLSSIFKQNPSLDPNSSATDNSKKVTKAVCDAWIDKRIEEILYQYTLKKSLANPQCVTNNSSVVEQKTSASNEHISSVFNALPQTGPGNMCSANADSLAINLPSPTQMSKLNSLTNSPITPDSGSWLNSATIASASMQDASISNQMASTIFNSLPLTVSSLQLPHPALTETTANATNLPSSGFVKDTSQALGMSSVNVRLHRRNTLGCSFCRNNKEVDDWVMSHQLKDSLNRVMCPILRSYVCPLCFASGDNAHTLGHCPLNPDKKNSSLPLAVRRRTNATGRVKL